MKSRSARSRLVRGVLFLVTMASGLADTVKIVTQIYASRQAGLECIGSGGTLDTESATTGSNTTESATPLP